MNVGSVTQISPEASELQQTAYVVDGLHTGSPGPGKVKKAIDTGYNAVNWTVAGHADSPESALQKIATFFWLRDAAPDLVKLVTSVDDLESTEHDGKLRILMGFQGGEPIGHRFHILSIFKALGVQVIQLTYNDANALGSGCLEPTDHGLTHFGIEVVREMNRLGMVIDLTHVGEKTSLDAAYHSDQPVIFSHSNARAVRENPRNLSDEQLRAAAETGGVVGVATFADFVGDTSGRRQPTLDEFIDHIVYIADKIGIDHVGIGTDIMEIDANGTKGIWWNTNTKRRFPEICGDMDETIHGISEFEHHTDFGVATDALLKRGFSEEDVRKVIGGNFLRVFKGVLSRAEAR